MTTYNLGRGQVLIGTSQKSWLIDAYDTEITQHQSDFDLFESYSGLISIRKALDKHAELTFKTLITEKIAKNYNPDDPDKNRSNFIELRRTFLDDIDGQVVLVVSEMFKPFQGIITSKKYGVPEGETASEYSIEIKEVSGSTI